MAMGLAAPESWAIVISIKKFQDMIVLAVLFIALTVGSDIDAASGHLFFVAEEVFLCIVELQVNYSTPSFLGVAGRVLPLQKFLQVSGNIFPISRIIKCVLNYEMCVDPVW